MPPTRRNTVAAGNGVVRILLIYRGEHNHVGVDSTAGSRQRFTEDCPVCCSPIQFAVRIQQGGDPVG
ncbi:MAG TPA: CPXCG motif-containing cysteine-rich protein [Candidatus Dormibacteraeota bacterium]|nr:CPXCG motif-containing cysteine-rich protein [Candidatus Dormibacteraeota bacterium]